MTQVEKAQQFHALHTAGAPLMLYNIWDAGSAKAVAEAGAAALATGSWSVAGAQGYADGQKLPREFLMQIVSRIVATTELPVSVDIEGGYGTEPADVAATIAQVIETGAIGVNFEDRVVGGKGLYSAEQQADRIAAMRAEADRLGVPVFINARTDVFFQGGDGSDHPDLMDDALGRSALYAQAGASGLFVPGLVDPGLIKQVCTGSDLPVNVMIFGKLTPEAVTPDLGVSRISFGPGPFIKMQKMLQEQARGVFGA